MSRRKVDDVDIPASDPVWRSWPVSWSGVFVGALAALAMLIVFGLIGVAVGSHLVGPSPRIVSWRDLGLLTLAFSISGAFFSFVVGGWVAARVAGLRRAEDAMMHGSIAWLVSVPLLVVVIALGGGSVLGSWYGSLAGTPAWAQNHSVGEGEAPKADSQEAKDAAAATRNGALAALTALILGLIGSALGGWFASGEPMNFSAWARQETATERNARVGVG